ncbi:MAG: hypothetical protein KDB35_18245 [Acidimicrobiales bacterium]|nr:hypothetical protein [Acidimicrobiales bacterium]
MTPPDHLPPAELPVGPPGTTAVGQTFASGAAAAPLPAGRLLRAGVLLVVAGIVLGIVGFVVAIVRADQASGSIGRLGVPGTTSGQLEAGTYRVEDAYNYGY